MKKENYNLIIELKNTGTEENRGTLPIKLVVGLRWLAFFSSSCLSPWSYLEYYKKDVQNWKPEVCDCAVLPNR